MLQCEEDSNTSSQVKTDPLPLRAFIFTEGPCISYDFTSGALSLSNKDFSHLWNRSCYKHCRGVFVGNTMYVLFNTTEGFSFEAYNPRTGLTRVTGLEKDGVFYPLSRRNGDFHPHTTLLHLGKSRICISWFLIDIHSKTTEVHCTKFDVLENHGQHVAENVSTKVYKVATSRGPPLKSVIASEPGPVAAKPRRSDNVKIKVGVGSAVNI